MSLISDFLGTLKSVFQIGGPSGVVLRNAGGALVVRGPGDTADAALTTARVNISGDALVLNSAAGQSGLDWSYTVLRPTTGMSSAVTLVLPPDDGSPGQVLATDGSGALSFISAGSTAAALKIDTTSLSYNSGSVVPLFTLPAGAVVDWVEVVIDTPFDGAGPSPALSVGVSGGSASKYAAAGDIPLEAPARTRIRLHPGEAAAVGAELLEAAFTAGGGATQGSARIHVAHANPA